jgi:hypothetical protein
MNKSFFSRLTTDKAAWILALLFFAVLLLNNLFKIYQFTDGHFTFTLDDPYIHLAMAENLWNFHYGVNLNEFSAPSSSILWPFIISPFALSNYYEEFIILLNFAFSLISLHFADKILTQINRTRATNISFIFRLCLLWLFILAANLTGLITLGMEHSLQVMLAIIIAWGLIETSQTQIAPRILWLAIIVAPLVRYECLAISAVALLLLFFQCHQKKAIFAGFAIILSLAAFSLFLLNLDLHALPDSVISKSDIVTSRFQGTYYHFLNQFHPDTFSKSFSMLILACYLLFYAALNKNMLTKRRLAAAGGLAVFLHLIAGNIGWFFRYEIYASIFGLIMFAYIHLANANKPAKKLYQWLLIIPCLAFVFVPVMDGIVAFVRTPRAASNIYGQQYQSHRFVTEFYKQPVAVNDLGWVSFKNDIYVLDLWGLASHEVTRHRLQGDDIQWMNDLSRRHNVKLAMIYTSWFDTLPENWVKVAEMDLINHNAIASTVTFFALDTEAIEPIQLQLQAFSKTLPHDSVIRIVEVSIAQ